MKRGTPSVVLDIMPSASTAQICQMCKLWKNLGKPKAEPAVKVVGRSPRRRRKKKPEQKVSKKPVLDQMKDIRLKEEPKSEGLELFGPDFPVPTPVASG